MVTDDGQALPVWDDGRWAGLGPLTDDVDADVAVVGLGGSEIGRAHV